MQNHEYDRKFCQRFNHIGIRKYRITDLSRIEGLHGLGIPSADLWGLLGLAQIKITNFRRMEIQITDLAQIN